MHRKTLEHPLPHSLDCAHNQWWHSKKERNISARAVTCAQNQWQKHHTNLKHLLQQSIAHKFNVEILEEKCKKISVFLQQPTYEINDKIYFLQEPKKSASAVALLQNQYICLHSHWRAKSIENKKMKSKTCSRSHATRAESTIKCDKG